MSGQAGISTNTPATGQPTITGSAEVGETLTAATSTISDSNGITNAVFSHQWVRSANGSDNDITNATGSTYVITNADVEAAIKVRVSFTDDDGYSETLTSNATTSVPVPAPVIVPPAEPQIAQAAGDTQVPDDWALIPSALGPGDQFRLIFLSSTKQDATSTDIADYNAFIQNLVANGHADIQAYSNGFTAVGCTEDDNARDNTGTTHTPEDRGVPIYWIDGTKVADDYQDFYNGSWDDEANDKNESGTDGPDTSVLENYPFTGCKDNGTKASLSGNSIALGRSNVSLGVPNSSHPDNGPLHSASISNKNIERPFYGLSDVFQIAPSTDTMVPDNWNLIPTGKGIGDRFRLLFLSSTKRNASPSSIGTYNTWIQGRAAVGHTNIQGYSDGFTVVGCTEDDDARDNTDTTFTSSNKGVPIYWLNGNQVADDYEDFYNGNWDDEANDKNESGTNGPDTSDSSNYPFTGCSHNGTKAVGAGTARSLGNSNGAVRVGRPDSSNGGEGPLSSALNHTTSNTRPMYGISAVFRVVEAEGATRVSNNWSLTPSELGARDEFRLLFLSSTTRNATSSDIEDYNTFIQNRAAAGHTDIQAYSDHFTVVGCTAAIDARDNTGTTFTSSDRGVPIYWMSGTKVADHYSDFYDGSWDNASNTHDRNELGINSTNTSQSGNRPWTGCGDNGTEHFIGSDSYALGQTHASTGDPATNNPIHAGIIASTGNLRPMYGLSQLFEVPPDPTLGDLVLEGTTNSESISLSPTFDDDTFTYTAAVPTGIDAVRLTATKNDSNSTVAITGDSDRQHAEHRRLRPRPRGQHPLLDRNGRGRYDPDVHNHRHTQLGTPPPPATVTTNWDPHARWRVRRSTVPPHLLQLHQAGC